MRWYVVYVGGLRRIWSAATPFEVRILLSIVRQKEPHLHSPYGCSIQRRCRNLSRELYLLCASFQPSLSASMIEHAITTLPVRSNIMPVKHHCQFGRRYRTTRVLQFAAGLKLWGKGPYFLSSCPMQPSSAVPDECLHELPSLHKASNSSFANHTVALERQPFSAGPRSFLGRQDLIVLIPAHICPHPHTRMCLAAEPVLDTIFERQLSQLPLWASFRA